MAQQTDFADFRRRASSMDAAQLIAVAESLAWTMSISRRADSVFKKPGRKPLVIPNKLAPGEARSIIATLEADAARAAE